MVLPQAPSLILPRFPHPILRSQAGHRQFLILLPRRSTTIGHLLGLMQVLRHTVLTLSILGTTPILSSNRRTGLLPLSPRQTAPFHHHITHYPRDTPTPLQIIIKHLFQVQWRQFHHLAILAVLPLREVYGSILRVVALPLEILLWGYRAVRAAKLRQARNGGRDLVGRRISVMSMYFAFAC